MRQVSDLTVMVMGAAYILFLPGFVLTFTFFRRGTIDIIERLALSFALSIAVVPLVAFYLNLMGVKLNRLNVILEVLSICIIAGAIAQWLDRKSAKQSSDKETHEKRPLSH